MSHFRFLAVSAVLLTGVVGVPAVSETQVFAAASPLNPQAQVSVYDGLWASIQGDSYTASPSTLWERDFELRYYVQSGTVTGPAAQITLPNGLSDLWSGSGSSAPIHINWTGATNTLKGTWPGIPADGTTMEIGAIPAYSMGAPPVSISRSISNPVLQGDLEMRTVTLDVTVHSSLAAFNWFTANLISAWDIPQGMAYTVGAPTVPVGFSAAPEPGTYYCPDPSALGVDTYHFEADVQFHRTGVLAQAAVGDLYYKPESGVNYGVSANVPPVSGTSMAITTATGEVATFSSLTPTDFTGNTMVGNSLELGGVATGFGPAAPSHIWVVRTKGTSISGTTLHGVHVEVKGANIIEGTITSPGGAVYGLEYDDYDTTDPSWCFDFNSATESDLAGFTADTYHLALKGSNGDTLNLTALVPGKDMPTEMPQFTQAMGFDTTDKTPTIGWLAATDPNVSKNYVEMEMMTDEGGGYEYDEMVDKAVTSHTPTEDLGLGAWYAMVAYCDHTDTTTGGDAAVPLWIDFATYTDAYFNVTPEPATLSLLAFGALAVLGRRRA
ncbi:MAG: PEP-CTERM sorting domain-containing protein [Planctomycetes bacterium]|nr:PEP-CTERM sorting domain-containing protein [Planctomycetota bacterium]